MQEEPVNGRLSNGKIDEIFVPNKFIFSVSSPTPLLPPLSLKITLAGIVICINYSFDKVMTNVNEHKSYLIPLIDLMVPKKDKYREFLPLGNCSVWLKKPYCSV